VVVAEVVVLTVAMFEIVTAVEKTTETVAVA
jgi:hypothetical protein